MENEISYEVDDSLLDELETTTSKPIESDPPPDNKGTEEQYSKYNEYVKEGLLPQLEKLEGTEEEVIKAAKEHQRKANIDAYEDELPNEVKLYKEAFLKSGEGASTYNEDLALQKYLKSVKVEELSPEDLQKFYVNLVKQDANEDVAKATLNSLVNTGELTARVKEALDVKLVNLSEGLTKVQKAFEDTKQAATERESKGYEKYTDLVKDSKTLYGIELSEEDKTSQLNFVKPRAHKNSSKANPLTTNDLIELVQRPDVQQKIAMLNKLGIFNKDTKHSFAANTETSTESDKTNTNKPSTFDDINELSEEDFLKLL